MAAVPNFQIQTQLGFLFFKAELPSELQTKILTYLKRSELFVIIQTCKEWQILAQRLVLWEKDAVILELTTPSLKAINEKVNSLLQITQETDLLLTYEQDEVLNLDFLRHNTNLSNQALKSCFDKLYSALQERCTVASQIENGFKASLLLSQLGLRKREDVESYANCLERKHSNFAAWLQLVEEYALKGEISKAAIIIEKHLKIFCSLATSFPGVRFTSKDIGTKTVEIIDAMKSYLKQGGIRHHPTKKAYFADCYFGVMHYIKSQENLDLAKIEMAIDTFIADHVNHKDIVDLLEAYYNNNNDMEAQRILSKYQKKLKDGLNYREALKLSYIFLNGNEERRAWNLFLLYPMFAYRELKKALKNSTEAIPPEDMQKLETLEAAIKMLELDELSVKR